jgi:NADH dehydrogenase FAD-containing subunit
MVQISSGPAVLDGRPASVSETALNHLKALNVDVRLNTKVKASTQLPDGKQELTLSSGEKVLVDLYIPTFGIVPNSSFVPQQFLDSNGFVKVDDYFRVSDAEGVFAIGDVNNIEPPQYLPAQNQSTHMANNLVLSLAGNPPTPYKASTQGTLCVLRIGWVCANRFW